MPTADDADLAADAEHHELVGTTVRCVPTTVTGAMGDQRVNAATWEPGAAGRR